jgi:hypothetical protein
VWYYFGVSDGFNTTVNCISLVASIISLVAAYPALKKMPSFSREKNDLFKKTYSPISGVLAHSNSTSFALSYL